jgi:hypothetical protein
MSRAAPRALDRITTDHSVVQEQVEAGALTEAEAWHSTDSRMITSFLGQASEPRVDVKSFELHERDRLVIPACSLPEQLTGASGSRVSPVTRADCHQRSPAAAQQRDKRIDVAK